MLAATDVPFDASQMRKKNYQDALSKFESDDKEARKNYNEEKDEGFTSDKFETWVTQNRPSWGVSKKTLQGRSDELTQTAMAAFGLAYQEKLEKDKSDFSKAAFQAGHYPEFI
ncbi:hypothetical protein BGW36DRAFT_404153 [Talaromyces proteolyticus]|uniref:Uncharacterized protein n=1 Tax=Talaromyces proteolyticus TaxID=1131652 RepID=A0AAD4Q093_9EURO|nr:uncharacterized protein BGW36DRAFT_404153 [Talaromyces proteolyticus]KAH8703848.1 hypothetical protein BGW36DRAFT_404153 [Talaromyces proteolyticus]